MEPVADKAVGDGGVGTSPASQRVILNTLLPTLMLMCTLTDCRSPESLALAQSRQCSNTFQIFTQTPDFTYKCTLIVLIVIQTTEPVFDLHH